jgi:hypothetical protein
MTVPFRFVTKTVSAYLEDRSTSPWLVHRS